MQALNRKFGTPASLEHMVLQNRLPRLSVSLSPIEEILGVSNRESIPENLLEPTKR